MSIRLDHTIVSARNPYESALFLSDLLGLPAPSTAGPFSVVKVGDTSLDYVASDGEVHPQHYAFLVSEAEFDAIFARIRQRGLKYWSDPHQHHEDEINTWDGGRGVYWEDPNGHLLEIITRSYGTGGSTTDNPHPLIADGSSA